MSLTLLKFIQFWMSKNERLVAEKARLKQHRVALVKQSEAHIMAKQLIDTIIEKGTNKIYNHYVASKLPSYLGFYSLQQAHNVFFHSIMPQDSNEPIEPRRSNFEEEPPVFERFDETFF